jgi:hypothetical protein
MQTISEFIAAHGLSMSATSAKENPNMDSSNPMDHWLCHIRRTSQVNGQTIGRAMTVHFSTGKAYAGKQPTLEAVLDCLASDASTVEHVETFEDWCADLGYDADSRKAEATFEAIQKQSMELKLFLPHGAFDELLSQTERL